MSGSNYTPGSTEFDRFRQNRFLEEGKIEPRKYQLKIASQCIGKNSLVVLPTGLGKTIIAVLLAAETLELYSSNSKIIIMAPTRPLINQHYDTFAVFLSVPESEFTVLTGKISPGDRPKEFRNNRILFFTPQTLRNDLASERYSLKEVCLMIFDEAHHASGDYPYTYLADLYTVQNPDGSILGLTASPGANKERIAELCENLHIDSENIHIRVRKDEDVKDYIKSMDIYKIGVNLSSLMEDAKKVIHIVLEERLQFLARLGFLQVKATKLHEKVIRKDLLELNRELVSRINSGGDKTGFYKGLSVNAQGLILYHMLELVEQQGLDVLLLFLEKLKREIKRKNCSKAKRILASDSRVRKMYIELRKREEFNPQKLVHPKFQVLKNILLDEFHTNPNSRVLVFVKLRASVRNIVEKFKSINQIKAVRFVGQASKSERDKGLSQKEQLEILDKFRRGTYNVLVSTNVAEEGLDIAECDLVIFYDVVASEIRLIQRKGRTARHREGKVIILYCRNTNDEVYLRIALNRLRRMQKNLKKPHPHQFKDLSNYQFKEVKEEKKPKVGTQDIKSMFKPQTNLTDFASKQKRDHYTKLLNEGRTKSGKESAKIRISSKLNMKYGLRKMLKTKHIAYKVHDSDFHIILYNRILLQIFAPRAFAPIKIEAIKTHLRDRFELILYIFDFIAFRERFVNEKKLIQEKLVKFAKKRDIQLINIDQPKELLFIINNIRSVQRQKRRGEI
jgi:Fanconi anemia group M protein